MIGQCSVWCEGEPAGAGGLQSEQSWFPDLQSVCTCVCVEVGDEGTRRGHQALCGLSPLLGAGQARQFGQGGDVGGSREGSVWQEGQVSTHLSTQETLAMVPGRGRGSQGPAASSGGAWCLTWLTVDSTRLGEVGTNSLCITAAKAKPGPAGQKGWGQTGP